MTDGIHPQDKLDAIQWAIQQIRQYSPQYGTDQLARNRVHTLEQPVSYTHLRAHETAR